MNAARRTILVILLSLVPMAGTALPAIAAPDEITEAGPDNSAIEGRRQQEKKARRFEFSILPHKPNYVLPVAYNWSPNHAAAGNANPDKLEVKFQLSIKTPVWDNLLGINDTLYVAYSQLALWQAYNKISSSPFRETNYEPEVFISIRTGKSLLGVTSELVTVSLNHQSNGREEPLSHSWNRVIANFHFKAGNSYVNLRPWFRLSENAENDDNPHMGRYYGYGELSFLHKWKSHNLGMMLRNNLRTSGGNKGAVQADWSFPLQKKIKAYVQYFNGYGESLVDYNHAVNRLGVGFMITDWL